MIFSNQLLHFLFEADNPSEYFRELRAGNNISYFPELNLLISCLHDPVWHAEGDVWTHTLLVIDIASELKYFFDNEIDRQAFMLGALCHDLGKPYCNDIKDGKIRAFMHDSYGELPTKNLLNRFGIADVYIINKVLLYVKNHLIPMQIYKSNSTMSEKALVRLEKKIHIPHLCLLTMADHWGRTDSDAIHRVCPSALFLLQRYINKFGSDEFVESMLQLLSKS